MKSLFLFCCSFSALALSGALVENIRPLPAEKTSLTANFITASKDVVLPFGKTVKLDDFKLTGTQTTRRAQGMQGAGEWRSLLGKCAIPTQKSALHIKADRKNLTLKVVCFEKFMERVISFPVQKRDGNVWGGDCIDLIISPDRKKGLYYQIIVDSNGNTYDAVNRPGVKKRITDSKWNPEYTVKKQRFADRWEIEAVFPLKIFGLSGKDGEFIDINVCRNEIAFKEWSSLNQVDDSFHELDKLVRFHLGSKNNSNSGQFKKLSFPSLGYGINSGRIEVANFRKGDFMTVSTGTKTVKFPVKGAVNKIYAEIRKPGAGEMKLELRSGSTVADNVVVPFVIGEPLTLRLQQTEFSGKAVIPGKITAAVAYPAGYIIKFKFGKESFVLNNVHKNFSFELNIDKSGILTVELVNKKSGKTISCKTVKLVRNADMFDEE